MWVLTGRNQQCTWNVHDDFYLLYQIFYPSWEEKKKDKSKYALFNYIDKFFSLLVFLEQLKLANESKKEAKTMTEIEKIPFSFNAMPDLGEFVRTHPLLKDSQYLAPFFIGCLFSYAENLQKNSSRLAAYNWLGTMALTYGDILQDIYPKVLKYIKIRRNLFQAHDCRSL